MFKVRTVSRIAVFFLAMAVASTAVAAQKATPSGNSMLTEWMAPKSLTVGSEGFDESGASDTAIELVCVLFYPLILPA